MLHIESLFKQRLRLEEQEKRLRGELQLLVQGRTAELDHTNEELQREISLRKQGEEELRKSKEQYRFLFEENPQPMWIFDLSSFRFLAFNTAALRHYGFTAAEFRELTAIELCPPEQAGAFIADAAKTGFGVQHRGSWRHRRKDRTLLEVEITSLDLIYDSCPARLVLANNVTAQRLLQNQLLQSQKMEVTNRLVSGVADNFNQLIGNIESDATTLAQKCLDPEATEPLKRIAATACSAAGLTRQLLALVRRHPMQPQSLDLNEFIETETGALLHLLGPAVLLEKNCAARVPSISADPLLVHQILHNLVRNARDAMPEGGSLTLSTAAVRVDDAAARQHEEARPGAFVCLMVSDTGCGMTPETQARLFEPFFTTKANGKGTGLGLATVHGLVKQHAGWIQVQSDLGAGSHFTVFFPAAQPLTARS
jgi:PAS domain S-box-containing protein